MRFCGIFWTRPNFKVNKITRCFFLYDSEGNLIEDKYSQGEIGKIALCAIPSA